MDPSMMQLWKKWNVRVMVLLSLLHQIVLIILGNCRKHNRKLWIRIVVWYAYLSADIVATFALGIITNNISHVYEKNAGFMDANTDLTAFWAPFLLLHLGGPDTITAYSLEDNELWLRHLLGLVVQTVLAIYISVMTWTHSHLSFLSLVMLFAGLIKYGERTWVLRKASVEKIRESFMEVEITHLSSTRRYANSYHQKLFRGYYLMDLCFQPLFLDLKLSDTIIDYRILGNSSDAFQVIEMSLVFMYNFLYTKAFLLYTCGGLVLRVITIILTSSVLGQFHHIIHKDKYSKIDLIITFILLYGAIILEIYSALLLLFSDRFQVWLMRHLKFSVFEALQSFIPQKSWSNNMSQLSLVSFMMKENSLPCYNFLKHFDVVEKLEKQWYADDIKISNDMKDLIFRYLEIKKDQSFPIEGQNILDHCPDFTEELEKSILAWHVVTETWYERDQEFLREKGPNVQLHCMLICQISRYMFYLLALHPNMVSDTSTTKITLHSILSAARDLPYTTAFEACQELTGSLLDRAKSKITEGTRNLIGYNYDIYHFFNDNLPPFFNEVRDQPQAERWMIISCTWLEMLPYAACKCRGFRHAQQLKCGGEFLSHVWVLTKCFGFTERNFRPRARRLPTSIIDFGDASS